DSNEPDRKRHDHEPRRFGDLAGGQPHRCVNSVTYLGADDTREPQRVAEGIGSEGGERDTTIRQCPPNMAKSQHVVKCQQQVACRDQSQCGEWLPSRKSPKRLTHLVWPVSLRMLMEDDKRGCKKKKRCDGAEVRNKAAPFSKQRYH